MRVRLTDQVILSANGVRTSVWFDTCEEGYINANYVTVSLFADQVSAALGLVIQESDDQVNVRTAASVSVLASTLASCQATIRRKFWRVVYTNGGVNQGSFILVASDTINLLASTDASGATSVAIASGSAVVANSGLPFIYTTAIDNTAVNNQVLYQGWAIPGTAKSAASWAIVKYTYDGNGIVSDIQWAGGVATFSTVWNNRGAASYS